MSRTTASRIVENLEWSLQYYASDPPGSVATLESMYADDRDELLSEACRLLGNQSETPGSIGITAFLLKKQELVPMLRQTANPLANRIRLAKLGIRVDPNLTTVIAGIILDEPTADDRLDLLELLGQMQAKPDVIHRLSTLLRDENPRIQSKMAMLMANAAPEGEWITEAVADDDPRVRANVIEALWKHKSEFVRGIFRRAADDPHHRVSANAIYGLYLVGDATALSRIRHLLGSNGLERRAGLWLAERTADPRFLPILGKLIGKTEPEARARCLRVIQAARNRKEQATKRGSLQVEWLPRDAGRARIAAMAPGGRRLTNLHPFDFVIQSGGQTFDDIQVQTVPKPNARTVIALVGECPDWRTSAGWTAGFRNPPAPVHGERFGFLNFQKTKPDTVITPKSSESITWCGKTLVGLRRIFDNRPVNPPTLATALQLVANQIGPDAGETHIVIIDQLGEFNAVITNVAGFELDVITGSVDQTPLLDTCRITGGQLAQAKTAIDAAQKLMELHRGWQAEYAVSYPATVEVDTVEVFSDWGYGWWACRDSNPGPLPCEGSALTN